MVRTDPAFLRRFDARPFSIPRFFWRRDRLFSIPLNGEPYSSFDAAQLCLGLRGPSRFSPRSNLPARQELLDSPPRAFFLYRTFAQVVPRPRRFLRCHLVPPSSDLKRALSPPRGEARPISARRLGAFHWSPFFSSSANLLYVLGSFISRWDKVVVVAPSVFFPTFTAGMVSALPSVTLLVTS